MIQIVHQLLLTSCIAINGKCGFIRLPKSQNNYRFRKLCSALWRFSWERRLSRNRYICVTLTIYILPSPHLCFVIVYIVYISCCILISDYLFCIYLNILASLFQCRLFPIIIMFFDFIVFHWIIFRFLLVVLILEMYYRYSIPVSGKLETGNKKTVLIITKYSRVNKHHTSQYSPNFILA
jgi:hypothetical protein